jgi:hypothetical protein
MGKAASPVPGRVPPKLLEPQRDVTSASRPEQPYPLVGLSVDRRRSSPGSGHCHDEFGKTFTLLGRNGRKRRSSGSVWVRAGER